ncbi:hypothetical protein [Streptomyces sp. NPDC058695]|uniref:hypothetical protein n=1 Tax=Streptomyces sp. NPDC058695 TaxID=3346604 RepID=UPI00365D93DA
MSKERISKRMRRNKVTASGDGSVAAAGDIRSPIFTNPKIYIELKDEPSLNPAQWPKVHEVDALKLGVHRARPVNNRTELPSYILREVDRKVAARVKHVAIHGGMVLLTGDSTSGKSRTAYHAVQRCMQGHTIYVPTHGTRLDELPDYLIESERGPYLLWLDDLEGFLGDRGMNPTLLQALENIGVAIVATMRDELFEVYANSQHHQEPATSQRIGNRLLRAVEPIFIPRLWSVSEIERASKSGDERITDAVAYSATYGVSEYLAAGPALLEEWQRAQRVHGHPRGAALVQTAVDLARTGFSGAVDINILEELHHKYLTNSTLRNESWQDAKTWATKVRFGVAGLLILGDYEETWSAFDYLPDALNRNEWGRRDIPEFIWQEALNLCPDDDDRWRIGMRAYMSGVNEYAIAAWEPLALNGNGAAASNLAVITSEMGDHSAARYWRRLESQDEFHSKTVPYDPAIPLYDSDTRKIVTGVRRDGETVGFSLHKPAVGAIHGIIAGDKGVGKSNTLMLILLGLLDSQKYVLFLIDWSPEQKHFELFKKHQAAYHISGNSLSTSLAALRGLERLVEYRKRKSGYATPAHETPGIFIAIEEAHFLFDASSEVASLCLRIAKEGRAVGVSLFMTIPDASLESFGGNEDLRSEMTNHELSTGYYMGDNGLQMMRDAKAMPNEQDPYE